MLALSLPAAGQAASRHFISTLYPYALTLPSGWTTLIVPTEQVSDSFVAPGSRADAPATVDISALHLTVQQAGKPFQAPSSLTIRTYLRSVYRIVADDAGTIWWTITGCPSSSGSRAAGTPRKSRGRPTS